MSNCIWPKQDLEERIAKGTTQPSSPDSLSLNDIAIIEEVFQHRSVSQWASDAHVNALLRCLKNTSGKPFTPLTVFWVGDMWTLIDGHHRYKAYRLYDFEDPVPVRVFSGTLDEAMGEALRANAQDKLPMRAKERTNAAWRLVISTNLSINKTAELSLTSRATVVTMRKVRDALLAKTAFGYLGTIDWETARKKHEGLEDERGTGDEWLDKRARKIAQQLTEVFGNELSKHPRVLWKALELYDQNLAYAFCEEYGIDPQVLEGHLTDDEEPNDDDLCDY